MANLENRIANLVDKFIEVYGSSPKFIVRAPGRVNLIGEHTDYNDGYVLPVAIDRDVLIAAAPTSDMLVSLYSVNFDRVSAFSLDRTIRKDAMNEWSNYPRGVAVMLQKRRKRILGANMAIQGDVPLGSGLSSSAAFEVASAMTFKQLNGFDLTGTEMALLCQAAENEFVGVNCGIMDQFISCLGEKDHALFVDCRTLDHESVPLPPGIKVIVADTMKKRGLVDSEYNTRRAQCEEAVSIFRTNMPTVKALRDITVTDFRAYGSSLPPTVRRRAEHVVFENERVLKSVEALRAGKTALFGRLMNQSHESLKDNYEVSCRELDVMVDASRKVPGVYGSRMTGAGFGGCTVSVVADEAVEEFLERVPEEYKARTGITPAVYVCTPEGGAEVIRTIELSN